MRTLTHDEIKDWKHQGNGDYAFCWQINDDTNHDGWYAVTIINYRDDHKLHSIWQDRDTALSAAREANHARELRDLNAS